MRTSSPLRHPSNTFSEAEEEKEQITHLPPIKEYTIVDNNDLRINIRFIPIRTAVDYFMSMDRREYDYITKSPDTFHENTLLRLKDILLRTDSPHTTLVDLTLNQGYIQTQANHENHGWHRVLLHDEQKQSILQELERAAASSGLFALDEMRDISWHQGLWIRCLHERPLSFEEFKRRQMYYDLRNASLPEFIDWLFKHNAPEKSSNADPWYYADNIWIDYFEERNVELFIDLFKNSGTLPAQFPPQQLEQGLWAMQCPNLESNVYDLIWNTDVSIEMKEQLIRSLFDLYSNLYQHTFSEESGSMWWDALAYTFHVDFDQGKSRDSYKTELIRIQDAMFETIKKILAIPSPACQGAALHGLGHLRHPDTKQVIQDYLTTHPDLSEEDRKYAHACITGEIM